MCSLAKLINQVILEGAMDSVAGTYVSSVSPTSTSGCLSSALAASRNVWAWVRFECNLVARPILGCCQQRKQVLVEPELVDSRVDRTSSVASFVINFPRTVDFESTASLLAGVPRQLLRTPSGISAFAPRQTP